MYGLVDEEKYKTLCRQLYKTHPGDNYITLHKDRFYELFDHLAHFIADRENPIVCEIGVSAFTRFYTKLFPQIEFVTVDRSLDLFGVEAEFTMGECGAVRHYNIDLNTSAIHPEWGTPPLGKFDYVLFCEVLEHLRVNPVQLFEELLTLLKTNGLLYITTPNFFSYYNLKRIANWENPQDIFHRRDEDKHAAVHYREYSMPELIRFIEEAGGKIIKAYYSDVWNNETLRSTLSETPQMFSNLVVVAALSDANIAPEQIQQSEDVSFSASEEQSAEVTYLQAELRRLQTMVNDYENRDLWQKIRRFIKR